MAAPEVKVAPDMSTHVTNGHQASTEDFAKHVFGGKHPLENELKPKNLI